MTISEFNIADVIIQSSINNDLDTLSLILSTGDFSFKEAFEMQIDIELDKKVSHVPPSDLTQEFMQETFTSELSSLAMQGLTTVARQSFAKFIQENPSDDLQKEMALLQAHSTEQPYFVSRICQLLYDKGIFQDAHPRQEVIQANPQMLQYLHDKDFLIEVISCNPEYFIYLSANLKSDKSFILQVLASARSYIFDYMNLSHIGEHLKHDQEILHAFISKDGGNLEHAPRWLQNNEKFVSLALESNKESFRFASAALKENELFILSKLEKYPSLYAHISEKLKTDPVFNLKAAHINGKILKHAPSEARDDATIALAAVTSRGECLEFVSERCKNIEEVTLAAVRNYPRAMHHAPKKFKANKALALEILNIDGMAYTFLDKTLQADEDVTRVAISQNGFILLYLDPVQQKNKQLVLLALQSDPSIFKALNPTLKSDRELCFEALVSSGNIYEYLPESLKNDVSFITRAFLKNSRLFSQIHPSLISDELKEQVYAVTLETIAADCPALELLIQQLRRCKHPEIKDYVMRILISTKAPSLVSMFDKFSCTDHQEDFSLILLIINSFPIAQEDKLSLIASIKKHYKFLVKDFMKRQVLLLSFLHLDTMPSVKKYSLLRQLLLKQENKKAMMDALHMFSSIAQANPHLFDTITQDDLTAEKLASILIQDFQEHGLIPKADSTPFEIAKTFFDFRNPGAFFSYISNFKKDSLMKDSLCRLITGLLNKTFLSDRHQGNSHREYLTQDQLIAWETALPKEKQAEDTEEVEDLLLCGTEVTGSCQRIDGDISFTKCLLGYVLDGKIRVLAIKNHHNQIIARAIIKIVLTEDNQPALFLEKLYGPSSHISNIEDLARKKALSMGVPLFSQGESTRLCSIGNIAPFEYEDASEVGGVTTGAYHVFGRLV